MFGGAKEMWVEGLLMNEQYPQLQWSQFIGMRHLSGLTALTRAGGLGLMSSNGYILNRICLSLEMGAEECLMLSC